jgi:integrase
MDHCIQAACEGAAYLQTGLVDDLEMVVRAATIMRFTGLRISQVWQLTWADFDLDHATMHVDAKYDRARRGRVVPISAHLVEYLASLGQREGRLFQRALSPEAKWVNRCWRAAGVREGISGWHAFRRGFETGLALDGANLIVIRKLIGHRSGVDDAYLDAMALNLHKTVARIPPLADQSLA